MGEGELEASRDLAIAAAIWAVGYIAMAEYDYAYQCAHGGMVTGGGVTAAFKSNGQTPVTKPVTTNAPVIYASHLAIALVLLVASGYTPQAAVGARAVEYARMFLVPMAFLAFVYHAYQLINIVLSGEVVDYNAQVV